MSDGPMLQRYLGERDQRGGATTELVTEDLGAFGWLRGVRERALMLELRRKDGSIRAVGYAWLERVEFDPSEGITLCMPGAEIRIKGRNLNSELRPFVRLFEGITRHRVPWVQETDRTEALQAATGVTIIETIDW